MEHLKKKPSVRIAEITKALMLFNNEDVHNCDKERSHYDTEALIKYLDEQWELGNSEEETTEDLPAVEPPLKK